MGSPWRTGNCGKTSLREVSKIPKLKKLKFTLGKKNFENFCFYSIFSWSACHTDLDCIKDSEATGHDHRSKSQIMIMGMSKHLMIIICLWISFISKKLASGIYDSYTRLVVHAFNGLFLKNATHAMAHGSHGPYCHNQVFQVPLSGLEHHWGAWKARYMFLMLSSLFLVLM